MSWKNIIIAGFLHVEYSDRISTQKITGFIFGVRLYVYNYYWRIGVKANFYL